MDESTYRAVGFWAGVAALVVTFAGIGLAIALSPTFSPDANALSNLGDASDPAGTATTEILFNGGLVIGGALGIVFGAVLAITVRGRVAQAGAILFGVTVALLAGIGIFPQDSPYHFQVAAGFYTLFTVSALVYGAGRLLARRVRTGVGSVAAGLANLAVWSVWIATGGLTRPGLAIPEIAGAVVIVLWVVGQSRLFRSGTSRSRSDALHYRS
jgi:hypothetical membrane protein